jgi:hypothetical protein
MVIHPPVCALIVLCQVTTTGDQANLLRLTHMGIPGVMLTKSLVRGDCRQESSCADCFAGARTDDILIAFFRDRTMRKNFLPFVAAVLVLSLQPGLALAYIGPGVGAGAIGAVIGRDRLDLSGDLCGGLVSDQAHAEG